jgi:hypothetical protein
VERYTNFRQEYLQVLAAQVLLRHNANLLKDVATPDARIRVDPRERIVVIPGFEVGLLLLGELRSHPSDNRYVTMSTCPRDVISTNTDHLSNAA